MKIDLTLEELGILVDVLDTSILDAEANLKQHNRFYTAKYMAEVEGEIKSLYKLQDKLIDELTKV